MPDISRLVIEVDSSGILTATGNLEQFASKAAGAGKSSADLGKQMGALQLVVGKLPGLLKNVAGGLMGLTSPATAVIGALMEAGAMAKKFADECIEAFSKYEQIEKNLNIVMESADRSKQVFTELRSIMGMAPVDIGGLSEAAIKLRSVGIAGKDVVDVIKMIGDTSLGSAQNFDKILNAFVMMKSGTGDTSRMMRQFAQAGVPVQEMLQEMGVTGKATADDITEAFRRMTSEGGKFFQGMEKDSKTIANMQSSLKGLKEETKALRGESISGFSKEWHEARIEVVETKNEILRIKNELNEIADKRKAGNATWLDDYREAELEMQKIQASRKAESDYINYSQEGNVIKMIGSLVSNNVNNLRNIVNDISGKEKKAQKTLEMYGKLIDSHKIMVDLQERYNNKLTETARKYNDAMGKVDNILSQTDEYKIKEIQDNIAMLEKFLRDNQKKGTITRYDQYGNKHIEEGMTNLNTEDRINITKAIDELNRQLAETRGRAGKITEEYADWVRLLASATSYTEDQVKSWEGLATIERYAAEGIEAVRDRFLVGTGDGLIAELLGMDKTDVFEEAAQKMQALVGMMTEARLQGAPWSMDDDSYKRAVELLNKYELLAKNVRGEEYLEGLAEQIKEASLSTYEISVKRLMIEKNISREAAQAGLEMEKQLDYLMNGYDYMGQITESINDALKKIRAGEGGYGQYAGASFAAAGLNLFQGSDVGAFVQGAEQGGGWQAGLINMAINAFANVLGGLEGMEIILNPLTNMLKELTPIIKANMIPLIATAKAMEWLSRGIMKVLNTITFGLFGKLEDLYDSLAGINDERDNELERLKAINAQYEKLYEALREQEEYYLTRRRNLNSQFQIENYRQVNDMILSPHGAFSTDPKDYIIATKNPETLMGNNSIVNISVINNSNASVSASERTTANGIKDIQIIIDGMVQQGLASGKYDGALDAASQRRQGRRVHA